MSVPNEYRSKWLDGGSPDVFRFIADLPPGVPAALLADIVKVDLEESWQRGCSRPVQDYLNRIPALNAENGLKLLLIRHEYELQLEHNVAADLDSYIMQFPELQDEIRLQLSATIDEPAGDGKAFDDHHASADAPPKPREHVARRAPRTPPSPAATGQLKDAQIPDFIGRYAVENRIASGAFGTVYKALDPELSRLVATKVPKVLGGSVDEFRIEARHLAQLRHLNIVSVYDFGVTDEGVCFVVAEFIDGESLASAMESRRFGVEEVVTLIAKTADALHYAHCRQIVHRDVKPANILLDGSGVPHVADFGLALNEEQQEYLTGSGAGTPAYMSPEQVRAESQFMDGRSDLFSLGIILYEMLAGRRPFRGKTMHEITNEIQHRDPKPIRVIAPEVPQELEQICLKCLGKEAARRYATADDLARELRNWLNAGDSPQRPARPKGELRVAVVAPVTDAPFPVLACTVVNRESDSQIMVAVQVHVIEFRPLRSGIVSRELAPTSQIDVTLPKAPGETTVPLARPIIVASQDAVIVEIRLHAQASDGEPCSPATLGGFRYRLTFLTDLGGAATTDELTLGRC